MTTPWKYVFEVTSVGQRSSPWPCKLNERQDEISTRMQAPFSCAQFILRQMHWTNVSVSIEAKCWVPWLKAGLHVWSKHKHKHKPRVNRYNASTRKRNAFLSLVLASSRFTRGFCLCLRRTCKRWKLPWIRLLCSDRWLKIELTARRKNIYPRCQKYPATRTRGCAKPPLFLSEWTRGSQCAGLLYSRSTHLQLFWRADM